MCGRFTQHYTWQELVALYRLTVPASNLQPRYNIAPTTTIDIVVPYSSRHYALVPMRIVKSCTIIVTADRMSTVS